LTHDIQNHVANITNATNYVQQSGTGDAPVLLNELIYMFLQPGADRKTLYDGQGIVQLVLLFLAFICIPWMLVVKPCVLKYQHKNKSKKMSLSTTVVHIKDEDAEVAKVESSSHSLDEEEYVEDKSEVKVSPKSVHDGEEEEFQFGELMIHQMLETIEFVLGSVSHTASYLRLWALSLAHSELATVFWDKIVFYLINIGVGANSAGLILILTFVAFSVWWTVTLVVMMFMELLSALLHALRLHWVEFQSKFYKGDGYSFKPLSFRKLYAKHGISDVTKPKTQ